MPRRSRDQLRASRDAGRPARARAATAYPADDDDRGDGNRPTHVLKMKHHDRPGWVTVGALWQKSDPDKFSFRIGMGVRIDYSDNEDHAFIVVPADPY